MTIASLSAWLEPSTDALTAGTLQKSRTGNSVYTFVEPLGAQLRISHGVRNVQGPSRIVAGSWLHDEYWPMTGRLLEGDALIRRASELGVSIASGETLLVVDQGQVSIPAHEHEIQRRVLEAERHLRENRLWLVAFVSAVASVVSAIAAWVAIVK